MNKVFDYGFTGSFFTNDVEAVSDIERSKMHAFEILSRVLGIKCVDYKWDEYNGNYVNVKYRV